MSFNKLCVFPWRISWTELIYYTFEDNGNDSIKHFGVKLSVDNKVVAKARETSKKKAEEKASKRAFFMFQEEILKDKEN